MYKKFNSAIIGIVTLSLILFISISSVIYFQDWYLDFENSLLVDMDSDYNDQKSNLNIDSLVGNKLYFNVESNFGVDILSVKLGNFDCNINGTFSDFSSVDLSSCLSRVSEGFYEVLFTTNSGFFSKPIFVKNSVVVNFLDCSLSGVDVNHLDSYDFYKDILVTFPDSCDSISRVCNNEVLSGNSSYDKTSCSVLPGEFICSDNVNGFYSGSGTELSPYEICSCSQLQNINNYLSSDFLQITDIDCGVSPYNVGSGFSPIGGSFTGDYDGQNNIISNLFINLPSSNNVGLFNETSGILKNISLINLNISGLNNIGGIVGIVSLGSIYNSNIEGVINSDGNLVGGLVGILDTSNIYNSYSNLDITGNDNVGGLAGAINYYSSIYNSYSNSNVEGNDDVGGLVGTADYSVLITNSYSLGIITGEDSVGGLVGYLGESPGGLGSDIVNSFSSSDVSGTSNIGSLVGYLGIKHDLINVFWNNHIGNPSDYYGGSSSPPFAVTTITDDINYFYNESNEPFLGDWDTGVWEFFEDDLPHLVYENHIPPGQAFFDGGIGISSNPYQISNCTHLQNIDSYLENNFILTSNIDCSMTITWNSGDGFYPIGLSNGYFEGNLNGQHYNISNLYIDRSTTDDVGLFSVGSSYNISNLNLIDVNITGNDNTGGLLGRSYSHYLDEISVSGSILGNDFVGGVFGYNYAGYLSNSYSLVDVDGNDYIGGLVGKNYGEYSTIINSYSVGDVSGTNSVGGLVGQNEYAIISNSYSSSNVTGSDKVGGLVGYFSLILDVSRIENSYATGDVSGTTNVGGFLGYYDDSNDVINSFFNSHPSNPSVVSGNGFSTGVTLISNDITYFYNESNEPFVGDWDTGDWEFFDDDLPHLIYENHIPPGQVFFDGGSGISSNPYQISNCIHLQNIDLYLNSYYVLTSNVDCSITSDWNSGDGFSPIGLSNGNFRGNLNGQFFNISNIFIDRSTTNRVGLFSVGNLYNISNLNLISVDITGNDDTGALLGLSFSHYLNKIYVSGRIIGNDNVGGIFGNNYAGSLSNSYSFVDVSGNNYVGGLVGKNYGELATITNSYSGGNVLGNDNVGGLAGQNEYAEIYNSYSFSNVSGSDKVGGLVGYLSYMLDVSTIENSYATGNVSGSTNVGGLLGYYQADDNVVTNSFYNNHSGNPSSIYGNGVFGGFIVISDNLSYFYDSSNEPFFGDWDTGFWIFDEVSQPSLNWS